VLAWTVRVTPSLLGKQNLETYFGHFGDIWGDNFLTKPSGSQEILEKAWKFQNRNCITDRLYSMYSLLVDHT
jgi:hypothetical protein